MVTVAIQIRICSVDISVEGCVNSFMAIPYAQTTRRIIWCPNDRKWETVNIHHTTSVVRFERAICISFTR